MLEPTTGNRVCAVALACLIAGCATSSTFPGQSLQQLRPHETTKSQVLALFGRPQQVVQRVPEGETLIYTQRKRSVGWGATIGAVLASIAIAIPAILIAPFTGGSSLMMIPICGAAGGVVGGAGGALVKRNVKSVMIELDSRGVVEAYQLVPVGHGNQNVSNAEGAT